MIHDLITLVAGFGLIVLAVNATSEPRVPWWKKRPK